MARVSLHWNRMDSHMKYGKCVDCGKPLEDPVHENVKTPTSAHHVFVVQTSYPKGDSNDLPQHRQQPTSVPQKGS